MRIERPAGSGSKGRRPGPWNAEVPAAIGRPTGAIGRSRLRRRTTGVSLVANDHADLMVARSPVRLAAGDVPVVGPGEARTVPATSNDERHAVLHLPALPGAEKRADTPPVERDRPGLTLDPRAGGAPQGDGAR